MESRVDRFQMDNLFNPRYKKSSRLQSLVESYKRESLYVFEYEVPSSN